MSSIKTSLHIGETLTFNDGKFETIPSKCSGKFIGEVTIDEYDAYGRKLFTETTYNDIVLPGSVFILEKMFGMPSDSTHPKFMHPSDNFPISIGNDDKGSLTNTYLGNETIIGFMAGIGGENGSGVYAPNYVSNGLNDGNNFSFIPFTSDKYIEEHIYPNNSDERETEITNYKNKYGFSINTNDDKYYYIKKLSNTNINVIKADGSGAVTNDNISNMTNTPVLAYAQSELEIDNYDLRIYFGQDTSNCHVNQIGLVSGITGDDGSYTSVRLVTCVNFKSRDLSNTENTLKITYRLYCV